MSRHPTAILFGMETAIGLTIARELGDHGVPVHGIARDSRAIALASRHVQGWTLRPDAPIRAWLPDLIAQQGAGAVLAISETDLLELAALPTVVDGCHMLVPRAERLAIAIDKARTLAIAADIGLQTPQTWLPTSADDFAAQAARMRYPLVAKWANPPEIMPVLEAAGLDWIKTGYLHDSEALLALLDRYAPLGQWPLIQQYCKGVGIGQMLHMQDGQASLRFQHRRLHEWPPAGGISTLCRAEPMTAHQAQMRLSETLLQAMEWDGPAMVEYRHDPQTGDYWLMEVNGRFWGSLPLARHCGACFAWESYRRAVLGDSSPASPPRDDLRARYMVPETKRLARILRPSTRIDDPFFRRRPLADLLDYVAAFFDPRARYYVFSLSDIRPWLRDMGQIVRKAVRWGRR